MVTDDKSLVSLRSLPRVGLGCMGMSEFYGPTDDAQSLRVLNAAFEFGYRHFDTADLYGGGHNEGLLGEFRRRLGTAGSELFIATKGGIRRDAPSSHNVSIDSTPGYLRQACERSLQRLGVDRIDLYYLHRRSPSVPIEDSVGELKTLMEEGKIGAIGLSEISVATLERAARVAPISVLQSEYSLCTRDPEDGILAACESTGVAFVAYSPLGRGFLSGATDVAKIRQENDLRNKLPRFSPEAMAVNSKLLEVVKDIALELSVTPAEVALGWVLAQRPWICAIPGTRSLSRLKSNFDSVNLQLRANHLSELSSAFRRDAVVGSRYPDALLSTVNT